MVPRSPKNRDHHFRSSKTHACLSIDRSVFPWTDTPSPQSAAATLYSSQSRIRKIIKQLNKELQTYHLQWQTSPMKIQGSEADIRCFF